MGHFLPREDPFTSVPPPPVAEFGVLCTVRFHKRLVFRWRLKVAIRHNTTQNKQQLKITINMCKTHTLKPGLAALHAIQPGNTSLSTALRTTQKPFPQCHPSFPQYFCHVSAYESYRVNRRVYFAQFSRQMRSDGQLRNKLLWSS